MRTFYLNAQVYHHNRNQNSLKTSPVWQTGTQLSVRLLLPYPGNWVLSFRNNVGQNQGLARNRYRAKTIIWIAHASWLATCRRSPNPFINSASTQFNPWTRNRVTISIVRAQSPNDHKSLRAHGFSRGPCTMSLPAPLFPSLTFALAQPYKISLASGVLPSVCSTAKKIGRTSISPCRAGSQLLTSSRSLLSTSTCPWLWQKRSDKCSIPLIWTGRVSRFGQVGSRRGTNSSKRPFTSCNIWSVSGPASAVEIGKRTTTPLGMGCAPEVLGT